MRFGCAGVGVGSFKCNTCISQSFARRALLRKKDFEYGTPVRTNMNNYSFTTFAALQRDAVRNFGSHTFASQSHIRHREVLMDGDGQGPREFRAAWKVRGAKISQSELGDFSHASSGPALDS